MIAWTDAWSAGLQWSSLAFMQQLEEAAWERWQASLRPAFAESGDTPPVLTSMYSAGANVAGSADLATIQGWVSDAATAFLNPSFDPTTISGLTNSSSNPWASAAWASADAVAIAAGYSEGAFRRKCRRIVTDPTAITDGEANTLANGMVAWLQSSPSGPMLAEMQTAITDPASAPTLTPQATGGVLPSGDYYAQYTWWTGVGETLPSPEAMVTIPPGTVTGSIVITLPSVPTGALRAFLYLNSFSGGECYNDSTDATSYVIPRITPFVTGVPAANLTNWKFVDQGGAPDLLSSDQAAPAAAAPGTSKSGDIIGIWIFLQIRGMLNLMLKTINTDIDGTGKLGYYADSERQALRNEIYGGAGSNTSQALAELDATVYWTAHPTPISGGGIFPDPYCYRRDVFNGTTDYFSEENKGTYAVNLKIENHRNRTIAWWAAIIPVWAGGSGSFAFDDQGEAASSGNNGKLVNWSTLAAGATHKTIQGGLFTMDLTSEPANWTGAIGVGASDKVTGFVAQWPAAIADWTVTGGFKYLP